MLTSFLISSLVLSAPGALGGEPPAWLEGPRREVVLRVGEPVRLELQAFEPLGRPLGYSTTGVPAGATFTPPARARGAALLAWTPGEADVGVHVFEVTAAYEGASSDPGARAAQTVRLVVERTWQRYLVPGVAFSSFVPNDTYKWGIFDGVSLDLGLYAWRRDNQNPGPAIGRVHLALDLLSSSKAEVTSALEVALGLELSFEGAVARRWLVPHYGLELGAFFARQRTSTLAHVTPALGAAIYSSEALSVDLTVGYLLPLSGSDLDDLRGLRGRLGLSVALW